jgi:4-methyl-5(b-hydroxyethyl)-thiazole monophosphate biosynthesis
MKKVLLLLANGFETYEASVFIDVFGWNLTDGDKNTKLFTCGLTREIKSAFNVIVKPEYLINDIDINHFDALAIPGGFEEYNFYNDAYNADFLELIHNFHDKGKIIASICVAALSLGKSGILNGKRATTYKGNRQKQLKEFGAIIIDEPIVIDDRIITSWNPSTAINVAFKLLEILTSKENAEKIKNLMGFF